MANLQSDIDAILNKYMDSHPSLPGVSAMATDRDGIIYSGAAGERMVGKDDKMTTDTVCAIFSTTKAIAATAALQLVEDGRLDLDAPAKTYAPDIAKLQVLDGFDDQGNPKLRAPIRDITTRMLLSHTAGLAYDFFNADYARLVKDHGQISAVTATKGALFTPLLFDPGERWEYGINMDWAGQVIEGITGKRLSEVCQERIFNPLGMDSTSFVLTDEMRSRMAVIHQRGGDGELTPMEELVLPMPPEVDMAGHGLYGTTEDYIKFIRMWLNDGNSPGGRVLKAETVNMAAKNGLAGDMKISALPAVNPDYTNEAEFFPGMPKSWGLSFMINEEQAPTGRAAGSLAWAGLANLFFWIDRQTGVGGFWSTQILPFIDPASVAGYFEFETAVYKHIADKKAD